MVKDILLFLKRNLVRISPFVIIIIFSVFGVFMSATLTSSFFGTKNFYQQFYKNSVVIFYNPLFPDIESVITGNTSILKIYKANHHLGNIEALGINIKYPIVGIRKNELEELLRYYQVTLKKGRMFHEQQPEIILSEQIVRNKGKKLGEEFSLEWTEEKYKIVGILEGETGIGFHPIRPEQTQWKNKLITFKGPLDLAGKDKCIEGLYEKYKEKYRLLFHYITFGKKSENIEKAQIKQVKISFNIFLIVAVTVYSLIAFFMNVFYFQRRLPEYGLLLALGLTKLQIVEKTFYENFGVILMGWVSGIGVSRITLEILKVKLFISRGWLLQTFPITAMSYTMLVPLGMLLVAIVIVSYKIRKLDPVEIIERRW